MYDVPYHNPRNEVEYTHLFHIDEANEFGLSFKLPQGVDASAAVLLELYLPDQLLDKWVESINRYASTHRPAACRRNITRVDILLFLAMITYMGII
jgi:hypothetical protein